MRVCRPHTVDDDAHADASGVPALVTRRFSFAECLHTPPMLERYTEA
jgi:hypothetical protein